jgi:transaldolase
MVVGVAVEEEVGATEREKAPGSGVRGGTPRNGGDKAATPRHTVSTHRHTHTSQRPTYFASASYHLSPASKNKEALEVDAADTRSLTPPFSESSRPPRPELLARDKPTSALENPETPMIASSTTASRAAAPATKSPAALAALLAARSRSRAAVAAQARSRAPAAAAAARVRAQAQAQATYRPPSTSTGGTELDWVASRSHLVPDTLLFSTVGGGKPEAATVSAAVLNAALASAAITTEARPWSQAVSAAVAYDRCASLKGDAKLACQLDKAFANVAALAADGVSGRVAVELDPRLARDKTALLAKAKALLALFDEARVPRDKLILRVPATWQGLQACKDLEQQGVATQAYLIFSLVQAAAATQAGVSVVSPNIGRTRDFFNKFPGVIRDPHGPREDVGGGSATADPGVALARRVYKYAKKFGGSSPPRVMASGLRSRADVLSLAGCDYLVVPARVLAQLSEAATAAGYNDGLTAASGAVDDDELPGGADERPLTPALAAGDDDIEQLPALDEASFEDGLGMAGKALLDQGLSGMAYEMDRLVATMKEMVAGTE